MGVVQVGGVQGDGERLLSKPSSTFFENIHRRRCNDGSRELIFIFHNPHRKSGPSPLAVAHTLGGGGEWDVQSGSDIIKTESSLTS